VQDIKKRYSHELIFDHSDSTKREIKNHSDNAQTADRAVNGQSLRNFENEPSLRATTTSVRTIHVGRAHVKIRVSSPVSLHHRIVDWVGNERRHPPIKRAANTRVQYSRVREHRQSSRGKAQSKTSLLATHADMQKSPSKLENYHDAPRDRQWDGTQLFPEVIFSDKKLIPNKAQP
jgi:hypothetical protein